MQDHDYDAAASALKEAGRMAERLAALARHARLLEFALDGETDAARGVAIDLKTALENAMDAESDEELTRAARAIVVVLGEIHGQGMHLSAQMTEMEVDGVLGTARMPVLTTVLTSPTA